MVVPDMAMGRDRPFLDRSEAAKAASFSGIEFLLSYDFKKAALRERLLQHGLTHVLHNLPAGDWAAGERGIAILPDRVQEFRDGVIRAIDYAKAFRLPPVELHGRDRAARRG
jgi:hydroxypyruvate isomerase